MGRSNGLTKRFGQVAAVVVAVLCLGTMAAPVAAETAPSSTTRTVRAATRSQRDSVFRLYRAYFLRDPEPAGLNYWSERYSSGSIPLEGISQFFARSSEFRRRYGSLSDTEFVKLVYRNVLGRQPDSSGQSYWVNRIRAGVNRGRVMLGFSESPEFQRATGTTAPQPAPAPTSWIDQMLAAVNKERSARGLVSLRNCGTLNRSAQAHSNDQVAHGQFSHTGSDGSSPATRIARAGYGSNVAWGENIAVGYGDISTVMKAWMASSGHRANLLNPDFRHVGFGRTASSSGGHHWTQDFGAGGTC